MSTPQLTLTRAQLIAADIFGYSFQNYADLLDTRNEPLSRYSRHLRKEPDVEYHEGYFDEDDA